MKVDRTETTFSVVTYTGVECSWPIGSKDLIPLLEAHQEIKAPSSIMPAGPMCFPCVGKLGKHVAIMLHPGSWFKVDDAQKWPMDWWNTFLRVSYGT